MDDYKTRYELLKNKHSLPKLDSLESEFEVQEMILAARYDPPNLLRFIRRGMVNLIWKWIDYMHSIVYPNPQSAILMKEADFCTEEEKKKILDIINRLIIFARQSIMLELNKEEQKDAQYIKDVYAEWIKIKPDITPIVTKVIKSWHEELRK
jgi:hypothetical protein